MARRSRAREVALQLLFQHDQNPTPVARPAIEQFVRERLHDDSEMVSYCLALYDGTLGRMIDIDATLTATATNWRLARMHPADRNVLRLAAFELLFDPAGQPLEVIIHEANELAARFGTAESPRFVNGVLDRIAKKKSEERPSADDVSTGLNQPSPEEPK